MKQKLVIGNKTLAVDLLKIILINFSLTVSKPKIPDYYIKILKQKKKKRKKKGLFYFISFVYYQTKKINKTTQTE